MKTPAKVTKRGIMDPTFGLSILLQKVHFIGQSGLFALIPAYMIYVWEKLCAKALSRGNVGNDISNM